MRSAAKNKMCFNSNMGCVNKNSWSSSQINLLKWGGCGILNVLSPDLNYCSSQ